MMKVLVVLVLAVVSVSAIPFPGMKRHFSRKSKRAPQNMFPVLMPGPVPRPFGGPFLPNAPQMIPARPGSPWLQFPQAQQQFGAQRFGVPRPQIWNRFNPAFGAPQGPRFQGPQQRFEAPRPEYQYIPYSMQYADKSGKSRHDEQQERHGQQEQEQNQQQQQQQQQLPYQQYPGYGYPQSYQIAPQPPQPVYQAIQPVQPTMNPCDPTKMPMFSWPGVFNPFAFPVPEKEKNYLPKKKKQDYKSCLDYRLNGFCANGGYTISDKDGQHYQVWCDFHSEPGFAWTLVMSHSLHHNNETAFCDSSLSESYPVHQNSPNWDSYRLSKERMLSIADQSSYWRATTGFPTQKNDFRDYVRGKFEDFDIITFEGNGVCKKVDYINIRGFPAFHTMAQFWQQKGKQGLHIDSAQGECAYKPYYGTIVSENNFGYYCEGPHTRNMYFRGTQSDSSTTQWWFGGSMYDL